ncbi:hypothetical protein Tco_1305829, partial [Tanacetum coccineum]
MRHAVSEDIPDPAQKEGAIEGTYETLGALGHRIVATGQQSVILSERISELERDNTRLRGTTMPNTRSGATMTREAVNELISRRVAEALEARYAGRNLEPLVEGGSEQGAENGDDCKVKYAICTLLNNDLTWWNSHKRAIGFEAAYAMKWTELTKRFQELVLLCTRMVPGEEDKVERFIGGLPNNIKGNGYARNAENKRRFDNNPRDNRGQQPAFKQQNVRGKNVARAYTAGSNERKGYVGSLPYYNKCMLHHEGPCTV